MSFRGSFWGWTFAAIALAVLFRAPWFDAPLGNDEGGLAYVAANWDQSGPHLYGHSFIDRPPLLLGVFRIAAVTGGTGAVRTIGAAAAVLLVLAVALLGREVGGSRAGIWAGAITATLGSSAVLGSVLTPAELLAALPSAGSVLLLLLAQKTASRQHLLLALAGLLAAAALLVKQSFGDALVAGVVFLFANALLDADNRRHWAGLAGAYAVGLAVALLALEAWETAYAVPDGATSYALLGFRIEGLSALAGSAGGLPERFAERLLLPLVGSGLVLVLVWSLAGLRGLKARPALRATIAAWGAAGTAGVLLGGSYWSHYLIELIPAASVLAGLALTVGKRIAVVSSAVAFVTLSVAGAVVAHYTPAGDGLTDERPRAVGSAIAHRSHPDDTIYVRYSQPNITYYSGLQNPYQYNWSLMLRTIPRAEQELRALLRGPERPTWIVAWEPSTAFDLDETGRTEGLIDRHYRPAGQVRGVPILLERGVKRPRSPQPSA